MRFGHVSYESMSPFARDMHVSLKSCSVAALTRDISSVGSLTIGASPSSSSPPACAAWEARRCAQALSNSVAEPCNLRLLCAELGADIRLVGKFEVWPDSEVPDDGIAAARHFTKYRCSFAVDAELLALDV